MTTEAKPQASLKLKLVTIIRLGKEIERLRGISPYQPNEFATDDEIEAINIAEEIKDEAREMGRIDWKAVGPVAHDTSLLSEKGRTAWQNAQTALKRRDLILRARKALPCPGCAIHEPMHFPSSPEHSLRGILDGLDKAATRTHSLTQDALGPFMRSGSKFVADFNVKWEAREGVITAQKKAKVDEFLAGHRAALDAGEAALKRVSLEIRHAERRVASQMAKLVVEFNTPEKVEALLEALDDINESELE